MTRSHAAMLFLGFLGLAFMLHQLGLDTVLRGVGQVGPAFGLVCLTHLALLLVDATTLRCCAGSSGRNVPFLAFVRAGMCGHAVNVVTPGGQLGEWTKYSFLQRVLPSQQAVSVLVLANVLMLVGGTVLTSVAALVAALRVPAALAVRVTLAGIGIGAAALALTLVCALRGVGVERWFAFVGRLGLPARWTDAGAAAVAGWQAHARDVVTGPGGQWGALGTALASAFLGVVETALILHALGVTDAHEVALLARANSQLVAQATAFVPMQAGTAEGGAYALFAVLGLTPQVGVVMELTRKARALVFAAFGLSWLVVTGTERRLA